MSKQDWSQSLRQLGQKLGKFKYPLLIFLLGLVLVAIPTKKPKQSVPDTVQEPAAQTEKADDGLRDTEEKLEQILSRIEGAGRVQVMLEYASGEKTVYQMDNSQEVSTQADGKQTRTENQTVLASGAQAGDTPVAVQTLKPTYRGALVVSDGAGNAAVRLDLVNAVSSLTGLGADKITVVKMKSE